jgi:hypothetical protein
VILLAVVYLLLVLVLPLALSAVIAWRSLLPGRVCPACGGATLPLLDRGLRRISALLSQDLERRWCTSCGWEGVLRVNVGPLYVRRRHIPQGSGRVTRVVDVRTLQVDGVQWRVRLECWGQMGRCFGRLVFVESSGRLWLDGQPLEGRSDVEVYSQARSLPDDLLASRLRELVSD